MVNKIVAMVIAFNPDCEHLENMIQDIENQGVNVIVVNNGKGLTFTGQINPKIIDMNGNFGIATAQNKAFEYAEQKSYEYVAIFDQDSIIPEGFFSKMLESVTSPTIGMVVPRIKDLNTGNYIDARTYDRGEKLSILSNNEINKGTPTNQLVAIPIASGAIVKVKYWREIGGMTDELFIDAVDTDFDIRLLLAGYDILQNNQVLLEHPIGSRKPIKILGKILFWNTNHSPQRRYTISRNSIWLYKSYHKHVSGLRNIVLRTLITHNIYIFFEKRNTIKKLFLFNKGIISGITKRSPIQVNKVRNDE